MAVFLSRLAFAFAALLIATVAFIGAVAFLVYAVFLAFALWMSPPLAAIATAGVLIVFAVIVLLIGRALVSMRGRARDSDALTGDALGALLGFDVAALASKSPFISTGVALLIGLLFGISPRLRRAAAEFLRR